MAKKLGRGRPVVYGPQVRKSFASVIRKHGLTKGQAYLAETGVSVKGEMKTFTVSLPTLGKFAKEAGIVLPKGRPAVKKAA